MGSGLTNSEKQTISTFIYSTYNASHTQIQSRSSSSRLSLWDLTCAYATGFGNGLLQGGRNIVNGAVNTAVEIKNTAIDIEHGAVTAASLLICDEPIVYEAQSQALQALESNRVSTSQFYWRFGETVFSFGTNEQLRAAIQWWNGEISDNECSEIIGSTAIMQLAMLKMGKAMGRMKPIPEATQSTETVPVATSQNPATGFRGSRGFPLERSPMQKTRNHRQLVNGRLYSGHALDQLQDRGIMPSVVENAIQHGRQIPNSNGTAFVDDINRIKVIVNRNGEIITVITL